MKGGASWHRLSLFTCYNLIHVINGLLGCIRSIYEPVGIFLDGLAPALQIGCRVVILGSDAELTAEESRAKLGHDFLLGVADPHCVRLLGLSAHCLARTVYQLMEAGSHISLGAFELLTGRNLDKVTAGAIISTSFSRLGGAFMLHRDPRLFCKGRYKGFCILQRLVVAGDDLPFTLQPLCLGFDLKHVVEFEESIAVIRIIVCFCRAFLDLVP